MTWFDYKHNQCYHLDQRISLRPQEAEIISTLLIRHGAPVSCAEFIEELWPNPDNETENPMNHISVLISRINKKIPKLVHHHGSKPFGWVITPEVVCA